MNGVWYVFEYLKCDSRYVTPHTSDPSKYAFNWKKFYTLWKVTKALKGKLVLINYADKPEYADKVRVMIVKDMDLDILTSFSKMSFWQLKNFKTPYITYEKEMKLTKEEFSDWLRDFNSKASFTF